MVVEDRLTALCEQDPKLVTGIDFVQVVDPADQTVLRIFFLIDPDELAVPIIEGASLPVDVSPDSVEIESISGGESLGRVEVVRATYLEVTFDGDVRTALEVEVAEPGDFSIYRLTVHDVRIDRFFNGVEFSFKQGCPSRFDCKRVEECTSEDLLEVPIDYLARDFASYRSALLGFTSLRYPKWREGIEADIGMMLAEVMSALGDEFSYVQDRYAREAYLETLSQRRSLRRHTQLVDYRLHDGLSAKTFLDVKASPPAGDFVQAGRRAWTTVEGEAPIPFEIGDGLKDQREGREFWVHPGWNEMPVHVPDQSRPCLTVGSTELYIVGHLPTVAQVPASTAGPPEEFWIDKPMLLEAIPEDPALPGRRHLVRITEVEPTVDPLAEESGAPLEITRLRWADEQALPFELCLRETVVCGNVLPATAGETFQEFFVIRANEDLLPDADVPPATERQGPLNDVTAERTPVFLHSLRKTEPRGLGWVGELPDAKPEVELFEVNPLTLAPSSDGEPWEFRRTLLDSRGQDSHFTLDDGTWRRIKGFRRLDEVVQHLDYATGAGFTLRFGDGEFGLLPSEGTVFRVRYRTDPGTMANLPAASVTAIIDPRSDSPAPGDLGEMAFVEAVRNPFPVTSGVEPEDADVVRQLAPEAFKELTFRAVREEDYEEIAERLSWVQRAGASTRWTGSWLTKFVTVDPLGSFDLDPERRAILESTVHCVRQAGREAHVRDPVFVSLDLEIRFCVEATAFPGQVEERVLEAVGDFFHPDRLTFGTPLSRSALEAAVQSVPGVLGVEQIRIRPRGISDWRVFDELVFHVADDRILRVQNDPRFPERGSIIVRGRRGVAA